MANDRRHYSVAVLVGMLAGLLVWLLDLGGVFQPFDSFAYDACLRLAPEPGTPPGVLLLDWEQGMGHDAYLRALKELHTLGARQIAFTFVPGDAPAAFFAEAGRLQVLFGRPIHESATGGHELVPLPLAAQKFDLAFPIVALPPVAHGVARRQLTSIVIGARQMPLLEAELKRRSDPAAILPPDYGIRFRGGPGSLPHVSAESLLAGRLVPELVRDRIVLIGQASQALSPGVCVPTTPGSSLSLLEFQGQAVDSLLRGKCIRVLDSSRALPLVMLTTVFSTLLLKRLRSRLAFWAGLLIFGAILLVGAGSLLYLECWLPLGSLAAAPILCLFLLFRDRAIRSSLHVQRLLLELTVSQRDSAAPVNFYQAREHWDLLVAFTTQALQTRRQLFLEIIPGMPRLREIAAHNCSFSDIHERRRDIRRTPYATAIEARGPIRLQGWPFLKGGEPDEELYLVPLIFADQLLGFWVVGVQASEVDDAFRALLAEYAKQIAKLLTQRREFLAGQSRDSFLARLLTFSAEEEEQGRLAQAIQLQQRQLSRGQRLFTEASAPTFVCDPFGQVREVNGTMRTHLAARRVDPENQRALHLLTALTGQSIDFTQRLLRSVLHDRQRQILPVRDQGDGKRYLLHLSSLSAAPASSGEPTPFGVEGIVCELVDWTTQARLDQLRERLVGHVGIMARNDLAAVELACALLAAGECTDDEREQLGAVVTTKVRQITTTLANAQSAFDAPLEDNARWPVDPAQALREALETITPATIGVQLTQPEVIPLVLAAPDPLRRTFAAVLRFLAQDARAGSTIRVRVDQTEQWVRCAFANSGFGFPEDRFRQLLSPTRYPNSEEFRELCTGLGRVRGWGGAVEADSKVGEGTSVTLCLPMFG